MMSMIQTERIEANRPDLDKFLVEVEVTNANMGTLRNSQITESENLIT